MGVRKKRALSSSLLGFALAFLLVFGAVAFVYYFGAGTLTRAENFRPILFLLLFVGFLARGLAEELLFRGYLTVSLARGRSLWASVLISSFLYAYFHRTGASAGGVAFLNFFLFGMLASLFMIRFGSLWGAAALHAGWYLGEVLLCGSAAGGEVFPVSILSLLPAEGSALVSGGGFGLEGGIAVTCMLTLGVAILGMIPTKED